MASGTPLAKSRHAPSAQFTRRLLAWNLAIVVVIVAMAARAGYAGYAQQRELALVQVRNLAQIMARYVEGVFDKTDLALRSVAYEYGEHMLKERGADAPAIRELVTYQRSTLPEVDGIRIANANGMVRFGGDGFVNVNIGDRDYFKRARDGDGTLVFSEPLRGRISGKWVVVAARRLTRVDGTFAGVVLATITTEHFRRNFAAVDLGVHGAMTLRDLDLRLVVRHPDSAAASAVGVANVSAELREAVRAHPAAGTFVATTALDGIERVNAYWRVGDLPFYVIVGISAEQWRAAAQRHLMAIATLAVVALVLMAGFSWLLRRAWLRREAALEAVKQARDEHVRLNKALEALAVRDPLTGLLNRRYLDETMTREIAQAERDGRPVSFVLIDLDHFKRLNDTHGHRAGDAVLEAVGALLARSIRTGDLACRYGGEEFLLVLPGASAEVALQRSEGLRRELAALSVAVEGVPIRVTLSAGIATYPEHGARREELIRNADAALYNAKASGRDCVLAAGAAAWAAQAVQASANG